MPGGKHLSTFYCNFPLILTTPIMKKHLIIAVPWWACLCLLVMFSCGGEKAASEGDNSQAFDSVKAPVYSGNTAVAVTHTVKDYAQWKRIFDEDEKIRRDAGLELRAISTNAEDPSMVHIMFATNDVDRAKDLIHSNDLKKRMAESGVIGEPTLTVFKTTEN